MDFVAVSAIYNGENHKFIYPDLMMKLKPVESISEIYLHHILMSSYCREYFRNNATGAQKSMPKINQSIVSNTLISLPPLAEQLMQAVLKEAFAK